MATFDIENHGNTGYVDIYDFYDLVAKKSPALAKCILGIGNNEGNLVIYFDMNIIHYNHAFLLRQCWEELGDFAAGPSMLNANGELLQIIGNVSFWHVRKYAQVDINQYK